MDRDNLISRDFSKITDWKLLNEGILISDSNDIQILNGKINEEIDHWKKCKVFEEIQNEGQRMISVRWVVTKNNKTEGVTYKVHLIAREFQEIKNNSSERTLLCVVRKVFD